MAAQQQQILVHGLVAGFAAYLTVVLLYTTYNLVTGRPPFETAILLGTALVGPTVPIAGQVLAWNGVHLVGMLVLGLASAWLVRRWELSPAGWYGSFFVLTAGAVALTMVVGMFAREYAGAVQWRSVVVVNAIAAGVMAGYLVLVSDLRTEL